MKSISLKSLKRSLLWGLLLGASAPAFAAAAAPTQTFHVYGQAQLFNGPVRLATPFIGTMSVDPNFADASFGHVGRVISI
ncbi:MAG: hypothetical protein ABI293_01295, partial [Rhodanobacter sp.]